VSYPHYSDRIVKMKVEGVEIFCRWGVEGRGGGRNFFRQWVGKEVWGPIFS